MSNLENRVAALEQDVQKLVSILDRELDAHKMALKIMFSIAFGKSETAHVNGLIDTAIKVYEDHGSPSSKRAAQILDGVRPEVGTDTDDSCG